MFFYLPSQQLFSKQETLMRARHQSRYVANSCLQANVFIRNSPNETQLSEHRKVKKLEYYKKNTQETFLVRLKLSMSPEAYFTFLAAYKYMPFIP